MIVRLQKDISVRTIHGAVVVRAPRPDRTEYDPAYDVSEFSLHPEDVDAVIAAMLDCKIEAEFELLERKASSG